MVATVDKETGELLAPNGGELTVADRAQFAIKGDVSALMALAASSADLVAINSEQDYKEIQRAKSVLVSTRVNIAEKGKLARDDANAFAKAVIAEEKRLIGYIEPEENRLKGLQFAWDEKKRMADLAIKEAAEAKHRELLAFEASLDVGLQFGDGVAQVEARIVAVLAVDIDGREGLDENFKNSLKLKKLNTLEMLKSALVVAQQQALVAQAAQQIINTPNGGHVVGATDTVNPPQTTITGDDDKSRLIAFAAGLREQTLGAMETEAGKTAAAQVYVAIGTLSTRILTLAETL